MNSANGVTKYTVRWESFRKLESDPKIGDKVTRYRTASGTQGKSSEAQRPSVVQRLGQFLDTSLLLVDFKFKARERLLENRTAFLGHAARGEHYLEIVGGTKARDPAEALLENLVNAG
jgi:hypothetical protein